jgi:hypothetical protein
MSRNANDTNSPWSPELTEETRRAFQAPPITFDGKLALKHADGRFGQVSLTDLMRGVLRVVDRTSEEAFIYDTVDALIAAGWAVD